MSDLALQLQTYNDHIENIRAHEYPALGDSTYLDHGGTTLYARSLVDAISKDLLTHLYGNPHSHSYPATYSSSRIDDVRREVLKFAKADPDHFDVVFVPNATAAIKLVMQSFADLGSATSSQEAGADGFDYWYHRDSHTSLVGVRELTQDHYRCLQSDEEVERWLENDEAKTSSGRLGQGAILGLFAYPGQSNMTGRRLALSWPGRLRASPKGKTTYSLFDAAALATTFGLDFSSPAAAPDFTALSFYKIFGLPDLGALIVRRDSGHILQWRNYFGGGTVDMVVSIRDAWHARKDYTTDEHYGLHDQLEDGTLPFHSIVALGAAMKVHERLFREMKQVSLHTADLTGRLYEGLGSLQYSNGTPLCTIYVDETSTPGDPTTHGATLAFNVHYTDGSFVPYSEVESLANAQGIYLRSGGLCNPGGIATYLDLAPWEMKRAWSAGHRCGHATQLVAGKPTGVVRASMGAMSTRADIEKLLAFMRKTFLEDERAKDQSTAVIQEPESVFRASIDTVTVTKELVVSVEPMAAADVGTSPRRKFYRPRWASSLKRDSRRGST